MDSFKHLTSCHKDSALLHTTAESEQGTSFLIIHTTPDEGSAKMKKAQMKHSWISTPEELEEMKTQGQMFKQGVWSNDETEQVKHNILKYCDEHGIQDPCDIIFEAGKEKRKDFYKKIALGINRPLFAVYRRVVRMYDSKNHMGKYSPEELKRLKELRKQHGNDWQKIGLAMGRSAASIKDRCRHLKEDCKAGPWKADEEDLLSEAVYSLTQAYPGDDPVPGIPWIKIAKMVGTRSERQCRKKWLSYCNMKRADKVAWNGEDDLRLVTKLAECGEADAICWVELAQNWPRQSIRSYQWLRAKWNRLKATVKDHQNLSLKEICRLLMKELSGGEMELIELADSKILRVIEIVPEHGKGSTRVTHIPLYLCSADGQSMSHVTPHQETNLVKDKGVTVVHVDLDGGEEPAVTTDVMLSGSSLSAQGSPLGLGDNKLSDDHESDEHSRSSK